MYSGRGFRSSEIGDVDVVKQDDVYHLFHLSLPNHDYIAHAVSRDGLKWERVKNALFISDPNTWDDDMLWTMHVSPNPFRPGEWRMFYTGLCMSENGRIQRVGLARSRDLYVWEKDTSPAFPIEVPGTHYEHSLDEGRHWVSFRDPFLFHDNGKCQLLAAARVNHGPVIRRGCVALVEETAENVFAFQDPLFHPMHYDDVETPNVVKLNDRYYLLGSIREDVKVHYWYADNFLGPYRNFHDNVLLPQGNYAARVSSDGDRSLVWNFFYKGLTTKGQHLMAPPKELAADKNGHLYLKSFEGFNDLVAKTVSQGEMAALQPLFGNPTGKCAMESGSCWFNCESGFEAFTMPGTHSDFRLTGKLRMEGHGKCGLVLRLDSEGNGYYLSLDLFKGIAQIRTWYHQKDSDIESAFHYQPLQTANYVPMGTEPEFCLIALGQYLEFALNGKILLTLADDQFEGGKAGFYVESARIRLENVKMDMLRDGQSDSDLPH